MSTEKTTSGGVSRDIDELVRLEYALWRLGRTPSSDAAPDATPSRATLNPDPGVATPAGEAPFRSHVVGASTLGDLAGLALSGGGIRSATFNLGVLQALAQYGLLKNFHYLSTVSGGGYAGSFWTAWRQRSFGGAAIPLAEFPARDERTGDEAPPVRHLREFSRFLSPQFGLFSFDTGRMATALVNAMVPAVVASLAGVTLLLITLLACAWWLLRGPTMVLAANETRIVTLPYAMLAMFGFLLLFRWVMEGLWRAGDESEARSNDTHLLVLAVASIGWAVLFVMDGAAFPLQLDGAMYAIGVPKSHDDLRWRAAFYPSAVWISTSMLVALVRAMLGPAHKSSVPSAVRSELDRASSWLLFAAAGWVVLAALWWVAHFVAVRSALPSQVVGGAGGALGLSGALGWLIRRVTSAREGAGRTALGIRISLGVVATGVAAALIVAVMLLVLLSQQHEWLGWLAIAVSLVVAVALVWFDPNAFGLHAFYRERIARAYLGASNPMRSRGSDVVEGDDLPLDEGRWPNGPVHLVCCAANDLRPRNPMENLYRGAASAVLSPVGFSVGDQWYPWPVPRRKAPPPFVPFLSSAVTASGAAFNSQMGAKSIEFGAATTFLLGTLGLRLGLWIRHPRNLERRDRFSWHTLPGLYFFAEILSYSRAVANKVFLSDGGHFENLGIYELVRRQCRYIIVCDCGADPKRTFDDLGNAVRRVREDFGVEIRIDLAPLRLQEGGTASQAMVAGEIEYPDQTTGTLLLFKPTITGDEPPDVVNYARQHPNFPQESTGDQFYDAAQWEAYRQLALHSVDTALRRCEVSTIDGVLRDTPSAGVLPVLFARAGKEWASRPIDFRDRTRRMADRLQGLDEALARSTSSVMRVQVYPELESTTTVASERRSSGAPVSLTATDLAESLLLVRKAMVAFEEIFLTEQLAQGFERPMYLGTTNYMARWAYAPLTKLWWPVVRAHCTEGFRRFMEERFRLRVADALLTVARAGEVTAAIDLAALRAERENWSPDLVFVLRASLAGVDGETLTVIVGGIEWRELDGEAVEWDAADFLIAPALWGMRLGDAFLDRTISWLKAERRSGTSCSVAIARRGRSTYTDRASGSYLSSFYRAHGFLDAESEDPACTRLTHLLR